MLAFVVGVVFAPLVDLARGFGLSSAMSAFFPEFCGMPSRWLVAGIKSDRVGMKRHLRTWRSGQGEIEKRRHHFAQQLISLHTPEIFGLVEASVNDCHACHAAMTFWRASSVCSLCVVRIYMLMSEEVD